MTFNSAWTEDVQDIQACMSTIHLICKEMYRLLTKALDTPTSVFGYIHRGPVKLRMQTYKHKPYDAAEAHKNEDAGAGEGTPSSPTP